MQDPLSRPAPLLRAPGSLCPLLAAECCQHGAQESSPCGHLGVRWGIQPAPMSNKFTVPCTSSVATFLPARRG